MEIECLTTANRKLATGNFKDMDPEIKKYFRKILNSFVAGLLWLLAISTLGIYFELGFVGDGVRWYNTGFYLFFLASLIFLIRFYYRTWKEDFSVSK